MTGKKVKGAGGGGKGFLKKIKKSIICNGDDHASRHPRAPHPRLGPRMEGEGPEPTPSNSPPHPQIKPSQVSMSHRTPSPTNSCKYVQVMPITSGHRPLLCMLQPGPLPQLHLSNKRQGLHATRLRVGALWEGAGPRGGRVGLQEGLLASYPSPLEGSPSCID